jgi:hypothetical protein
MRFAESFCAMALRVAAKQQGIPKPIEKSGPVHSPFNGFSVYFFSHLPC